MSFSNAPTSVYGSAIKYTGGKTPVAPSSYIFSYYLDIVPDVAITVTPVFSLIGSSTLTTTLKASPPSQTFTNAMKLSQLTGTFILNGFTGQYNLQLAVSGPDSAKYYKLGSAIRVTILSSTAPPPPPNLLKVTFSTSGANAYAYFDSATDGAQSVAEIAFAIGAWPCKLLFTFKGVDNTVCDWMNNTVIQVGFTSPPLGNSDLTVGSSVKLLAGRVKAECSSGNPSDCTSYAFAPGATVVADAPSNPTSPTIVLTMPSVIAKCDNLTVDATCSSGSGGRPWTRVLWDVSSDTASAQSIALARSILRDTGNSTSSLIVIPSGVLKSAKYQITLSLTNWFGISRVFSADFAVSSSTDTPTVNILGESTRTLSVYDQLELSAEGSVSGCSSSNTLVYTWQVYKNYVLKPVVSESKDPRKLMIKAYDLKAGNTYQCSVKVATTTLN